MGKNLIGRFRFYLRSINRHGVHSPFVFDLLEKGLRIRKGVPLLRRLQEYFGAAIHVIEEKDLPLLLYKTASPGSIFYLPDIHASDASFQQWRSISMHPEVNLSIEFWEGGLLIFSKEFKEKQQFVLRYKW